MSLEEIGTVEAIYRYPVKSMAGERLASAYLRWPGIDGDRQYAFYRTANISRFPWLTGREVPELVTYVARYLDPTNPRHSAVRVAVGNREYDVGDPALRDLLTERAGEEIRLLQVGRGTFDAMPISVLSTATLAQMEARCARTLDVRRFRANILVTPVNGKVVRETDWLGGTLAIGDGPSAPKLRANVPIDRCVMITVDPESATPDPAVLRHVVEGFNNEIGIRCATEAIGTISVGDPVRLARSS
jgi:uncharacterized protein YcbX